MILVAGGLGVEELRAKLPTRTRLSRHIRRRAHRQPWKHRSCPHTRVAPDRARNEHLIMLAAGDFVDAHARHGPHRRLRLSLRPSYRASYGRQAASACSPSIRRHPPRTATVCSVAPGHVSRRATTRTLIRSLTTQNRAPHRTVPPPGCSWSTGWPHRRHAGVQASIWSAYNEVQQASICHVHATQPYAALRALGEFRHAVLAAEADMYLDGPCGLVCAPFCSLLQTRPTRRPRRLRRLCLSNPPSAATTACSGPHGGYAIAFADNVHARAPLRHAAPGLGQFNLALGESA